jgi:hypothetical protein
MVKRRVGYLISKVLRLGVVGTKGFGEIQGLLFVGYSQVSILHIMVTYKFCFK